MASGIAKISGAAVLFGSIVGGGATWVMTAREDARQTVAIAAAAAPRALAPPDRCGPAMPQSGLLDIGRSLLKRIYAPHTAQNARCSDLGKQPYPACWRVECSLEEVPWRSTRPERRTYSFSVITWGEGGRRVDATLERQPLPQAEDDGFDALLARAEAAGRDMQADVAQEGFDAAKAAAARLEGRERSAANAQLKAFSADLDQLWLRTADLRVAAAGAQVDAGNFQAAETLLTEATSMSRGIRSREAGKTALTIEAMRTLLAGKRREVALRARCGPKPRVGGLDGELAGAANAVRNVAHDPDSVDVARCTDPALTERCWVSTCNVRAKNTFGALVLQRMVFHVDKSEISGVPIED